MEKCGNWKGKYLPVRTQKERPNLKDMAADNFYPKGEYIFREGESADFAYVLKSGCVEIL